ncbi:RluA family pseudouridine synthase [Butyricicoccus pullicaecorum]|uniref:RluA family pseudouridine synthase n=1 Tax=Butyricicoccus pullicaecorum TaxID=501571 RepID=UPI003990B3FC
MNEQIFAVLPEQEGKRIDAFVCEQLDGITRSMVQNWIEQGHVTLASGKTIKKNYKVNAGDEVIVQMPEPQSVEIEPENIPIDIVYEDEDIIVVNKARGMVVHPAVGNWNGTLVNALMYHCGDRLSGINGEIRPGIVHRIDKDTSGLLVVAKNDLAHQSLAEQIACHSAAREYQAIVVGAPREDQGTIDQPIGRHKVDRKKMAIVPDGRHAVTHYQVLKRFRGYSLLAFQLETGRTHQIRVHMASIGHPIIGDPLYGLKKDRFSGLDGQCLHAWRLSLDHPRTGERMVFEAPLPEYFTAILNKMVQENG